LHLEQTLQQQTKVACARSAPIDGVCPGNSRFTLEACYDVGCALERTPHSCLLMLGVHWRGHLTVAFNKRFSPLHCGKKQRHVWSSVARQPGAARTFAPAALSCPKASACSSWPRTAASPEATKRARRSIRLAMTAASRTPGCEHGGMASKHRGCSLLVSWQASDYRGRRHPLHWRTHLQLRYSTQQRIQRPQMELVREALHGTGSL
jgi:hypothetical protein